MKEFEIRKKGNTVTVIPNGIGKGILIPSELYPLNSKPKVFSEENTKPATEKMLEAFDRVKFRAGYCYSNADELVKELKKVGYNGTMYVGWVFVSGMAAAVHHAWVMCNGSLLDLSDDHRLMCYGSNGENFTGKSQEECQELVVAFQEWALNLKNSERCCPVGKTSDMVYVGSPCSKEEGKEIFSRLWERCPNHPSLAEGTDKDGYSPLQRKLKEHGLI